jgi:soluble lytic murein transglycosylase-like protein
MSFFSKIKNWYLIIILGIIGVMYYNINRRLDYFEGRLEKSTGTISLRMYESIEHWSDSFDVPKYIAYNIAYRETRYEGPFDFNYNPFQSSGMGAVGPMQIIPKYAGYFNNGPVSRKQLQYNIDLNVKLSMKMIKYWHNKYHDWTLAAGAYNSGKPIRNDYAVYVANNKDYKNKWERL